MCGSDESHLFLRRSISLLIPADAPPHFAAGVFAFAANADAALKRNHSGERIKGLFSPLMTVNVKAHISRLICWHHCPENDTVSGVSLKQRSSGIAVCPAAENPGNLAVTL